MTTPRVSEVALAKMQCAIWELQQRVDDLAALVHAHIEAQAANDPKPTPFGACEHGRLLLRPCPECQRRP